MMPHMWGIMKLYEFKDSDQAFGPYRGLRS